MLSQASAVPETTTLEGDDALETLRRTGWGSLMAATIRRFRAADGFSHTRALAYQVTLTAIPALIGFVGLAASLEWATLKSVLETTVTDLAPGPAGSALAKAIEQGSEASGATAVVGLAAALVAGTTAMGQIERGANRVLLWLAGTALLALYVGFSDQFGSTYGPLAGFIGLLLWAFLSSLALYLGVAFAAQLEAVRAGADAPRESVDGQRSAGGAEAAKTRLESTKSSVR